MKDKYTPKGIQSVIKYSKLTVTPNNTTQSYHHKQTTHNLLYEARNPDKYNYLPQPNTRNSTYQYQTKTVNKSADAYP